MAAQTATTAPPRSGGATSPSGGTSTARPPTSAAYRALFSLPDAAIADKDQDQRNVSTSISAVLYSTDRDEDEPADRHRDRGHAVELLTDLTKHRIPLQMQLAEAVQLSHRICDLTPQECDVAIAVFTPRNGCFVTLVSSSMRPQLWAPTVFQSQGGPLNLRSDDRDCDDYTRMLEKALGTVGMPLMTTIEAAEVMICPWQGQTYGKSMLVHTSRGARAAITHWLWKNYGVKPTPTENVFSIRTFRLMDLMLDRLWMVLHCPISKAIGALTSCLNGNPSVRQLRHLIRAARKSQPAGNEGPLRAASRALLAVAATLAFLPHEPMPTLINLIAYHLDQPEFHSGSTWPRCLWTISTHLWQMMHLPDGVSTLDLRKLFDEERCRFCDMTIRTIRPLTCSTGNDGYYDQYKGCSWCGREHSCKKCNIIREMYPDHCEARVKQEEAVYRMQGTPALTAAPAFCTSTCSLNPPCEATALTRIGNHRRSNGEDEGELTTSDIRPKATGTKSAGTSRTDRRTTTSMSRTENLKDRATRGPSTENRAPTTRRRPSQSTDSYPSGPRRTDDRRQDRRVRFDHQEEDDRRSDTRRTDRGRTGTRPEPAHKSPSRSSIYSQARPRSVHRPSSPPRRRDTLQRPSSPQRTQRLRSQERTAAGRSKSARQETFAPSRRQVAEQAKEQQFHPGSRRPTIEPIQTLTPPTTDAENSDPISSAADPQEDSWGSEGTTSPVPGTIVQTRALTTARQHHRRSDAMDQTTGDDALLINLDSGEESEILGLNLTTSSPPRGSSGESSPMETDMLTPETPMETDVSTSDTNTILSFQPLTRNEWLAEWRQENNRTRTRTEWIASGLEGTCQRCRKNGSWYWTNHSEKDCRKGTKRVPASTRNEPSSKPNHARKKKVGERVRSNKGKPCTPDSIINLANMTNHDSASDRNNAHVGTEHTEISSARTNKTDDELNNEGIPDDLLREVQALPTATRTSSSPAKLRTHQRLQRRMARIEAQEASEARPTSSGGSRMSARCKFCWQEGHKQDACPNKRQIEERSIESKTEYMYRFSLARNEGALPYAFQRQEGKLSVSKLLERRDIGASSRMITPTLGPYGVDLLMDSGLSFCSMRLETLTRLLLSTTSGTMAADTIRSYEPGQLADTGPLSVPASQNLHTAYVVLQFGDIGWSSVPFIIDDRDSGIDGLNDAIFLDWQVVTEACSVQDGNPCGCGGKKEDGRHLVKMEWSKDGGKWDHSYMATRSEDDETQSTNAAATGGTAPLFRTGALHLA